jgi:cell division protein FtsB
MASKRPVLLKRIGTAAVLLVAAVFAVEGGEFGTTDLVRQRREKARIQRSIDSLRLIVDSLKKYEDNVRRDPATQERLAREVFGMVRGNKEIVYRFAEPIDSMRRKP